MQLHHYSKALSAVPRDRFIPAYIKRTVFFATEGTEEQLFAHSMARKLIRIFTQTQ